MRAQLPSSLPSSCGPDSLVPLSRSSDVGLTRTRLSFSLGIDAAAGNGTKGRLERLTAKGKGAPTYEASIAKLNRFFAPEPVEADDGAIDIDGDESAAATGRLAEIEKLPTRVVMALAIGVEHLATFNLAALFRRGSLTAFADARTMTLGADALSALEIFSNGTDGTTTGSLYRCVDRRFGRTDSRSLLDHCKTSFGKRLLKRWLARPLLSLEQLKARQDTVEEIVGSSSYVL